MDYNRGVMLFLVDFPITRLSDFFAKTHSDP